MWQNQIIDHRALPHYRIPAATLTRAKRAHETWLDDFDKPVQTTLDEAEVLGRGGAVDKLKGSGCSGVISSYTYM